MTAMELLPLLKKLYQEWDLRVMVLLSLTLQVVLILLGSRRKYNHKSWIGTVVWLAYLASDSIATISLGVISSNLKGTNGGNSRSLKANIELTTLWVPFLLLHLGGPDTITAYSLEDNELWLRHLLGLVIQTTTAVSVLFMAWTGSRLSVMSLLMLCAGLIKYGERTWALRSASSEKLKGSLVKESLATNNTSSSDHDDFIKAYKFLEVTKCLFVDIRRSPGDKSVVKNVFNNLTFESAFKIIEIQLGLIFDLLYTKAPLLYTTWGLLFRFISFFLTCFVLVFFSTFFRDHTHKYSKIDISITFLLLAVAIILEIYAALSLLPSDRLSIILKMHSKSTTTTTSTLQAITSFTTRPRWSHMTYQFSLLSFAKKEKHLPCQKILKLLSFDEKRWSYIYDKKVPESLKELLFEHLKVQAQWDRSRLIRYYSHGIVPKLLNVNQVQAILDYHIITEIMYEVHGEEIEKKKISSNDETFVSRCEWIKQLSRYMLYIILVHPSLLSVEIGQLDSFTRQIDDKAMEVLPRLVQKFDEGQEGYNELFRWFISRNEPDKLWNDSFQSIITHKLSILSIEDKWKELSHIWLDIVTYVAITSKGRQHGQQLTQGGEFLTHIWLLISHFDIQLTREIETEDLLGVTYFAG